MHCHCGTATGSAGCGTGHWQLYELAVALRQYVSSIYLQLRLSYGFSTLEYYLLSKMSGLSSKCEREVLST